MGVLFAFFEHLSESYLRNCSIDLWWSCEFILRCGKKNFTSKKNLECLAIEIYRFLRVFSPPILKDISEVRANFSRNFQSLYSFAKKTVTFETEDTKNVFLWKTLRGKSKIGKVVWFVKRTCKTLALPKHKPYWAA